MKYYRNGKGTKNNSGTANTAENSSLPTSSGKNSPRPQGFGEKRPADSPPPALPSKMPKKVLQQPPYVQVGTCSAQQLLPPNELPQLQIVAQTMRTRCPHPHPPLVEPNDRLRNVQDIWKMTARSPNVHQGMVTLPIGNITGEITLQKKFKVFEGKLYPVLYDWQIQYKPAFREATKKVFVKGNGIEIDVDEDMGKNVMLFT